MKHIHYYANPEFKAFDQPQNNEMSLTTSQLTKEMVVELITKHASVRPPYVLVVPRTLLFHAHCWLIPETLLIIVPLPEAVTNVNPIAIATLSFVPKSGDESLGLVIYVHAKRAIHSNERWNCVGFQDN